MSIWIFLSLWLLSVLISVGIGYLWKDISGRFAALEVENHV